MLTKRLRKAHEEVSDLAELGRVKKTIRVLEEMIKEQEL